MGFFKNLFGGGENPADAAMPYLNQIPGVAKQYYNPFIQQGQDAYNQLNPQLSSMTNDPAAFLESMMGAYQPSRGYQLRRDEALRAAGNTAAAGGMRGSISDMTNQTRLTDALLGEDMQQWLSNVMGIQNRGMQGLGHFYDTGYDASGRLSSDLTNNLASQGSLAFQGQREKNQRNSDILKSIMQGAGAIAGFALPGGGTIGGALASKLLD